MKEKTHKHELSWGLPHAVNIIRRRLGNANRPQGDRCRAIVKLAGKTTELQVSPRGRVLIANFPLSCTVVKL